MDRPDFRLGCDVTFDVEVEGLDERHVQVLVAAALFEAGAEPGDVIEVSVSFVDRGRIRAANAEHRGVDAATDVLSFPIDHFREQLGASEPRVLGDLLVCPEYVGQQLDEGTTMQDDRDLVAALERCVVHGMLHLCDFDHERGDGDAAEMLALEELVLERVRCAGGAESGA